MRGIKPNKEILDKIIENYLNGMSCKDSTLNISDLLYKDASIYLDRKYKTYLEFMKEMKNF